MGNELLSSKTVIQEEAPKIISVPALPTAVLASIGVTERGPIDIPTLVTSFEEWTRHFGGYTTNADCALAAQGFFDNGGQFLYQSRIVHKVADVNQSAAATLMLQTPVTAPTYGTVTGTETEPFDLTAGDTLDFSVDAGATDTATIDAAAASIECANSETYDLADGLTLTVKIDGEAVAQTIEFNTAEFADIANATAEEVAAVINAEIVGASATASSGGTKVTITSDTQGTDSGVEVTGGTANSGGSNRLAFSTSPVSGTGDVADINAVTVAELKTVIEADVTGVTVTAVSGKVSIATDTIGASGSIQVEATSTADDELGLDNATHSGSSGAAQDTLKVDGKTHGAYANSLSIQTAAATSGDSDEYNFIVLEDGVIQEIFPNVSQVDSTADNFVEKIVNNADTGSNLVTVTDQSVAANPDTGTFGPMAGGDDGLTGLVDADFTGSDSAGTGLYAFDEVQGITLLVIPGRATTTVQTAMLDYAENERDRAVFCVLDPPASYTATQMVSYVDTGGSPLNGSSEQGAIYWPQVKILNPNKTIFGDEDQIVVPPSGIICGVIARTDATAEGGIYQPPAGVDRGILRGVLGFETEEVKDEAKRDLVYPKRINPLRSDVGQRPYIDGTRTLKGDGNFPTIAERRGASYIEQSIKKLVEFARHSNNTPELRRDVARVVYTFLYQQMEDNAFVTKIPDEAFKVDFGDGLNQPCDQFLGRLTGRVGLAFAKPADFIILKFGQDFSAIEQQLQTAGNL